MPASSLATTILLAGIAAREDRAQWMVAEGFWELKETDWPVLERLSNAPSNITALARALEITQQATSKAVTDLAERGYVRRVHAPADGRQRLVELTPIGSEIIREGARWAAEVERRLVEQAGVDDARIVRRMLTAFTAAVEHVAGVGRRSFGI